MEMHIWINDFCDICGDAMSEGEKFVLLIGNRDSTGFRGGVFVQDYPIWYPGTTNFMRVDTRSTSKCWAPEVKEKGKKKSVASIIACRDTRFFLSSSAKAATSHSDCLKFVIRRCKNAASGRLNYQDILDRIWIASVWREPFPGVPQPLCLPRGSIDRGHTLSSLPQFRYAVDMYVFPNGNPLPSEICDIIFGWSRSALLWEYLLPLEFCDRVLSMPTGEEKTKCTMLPFDQILSWKRNSGLLMAESSAKGKGKAKEMPTIVRLTVDGDGLKQIERLAERPAHEPKEPGTGAMAFVVEAGDKFRDAVIETKFDYVRVRLQSHGSTQPTINFWDTPTPPSLENCPLPKRHIAESKRFITIDMDPSTSTGPRPTSTGLTRVTGLTFFVAQKSIWGVHAHTTARPSVTQSFNRVNPSLRKAIQWVYMPLGPKDPVTGFGCERSEDVDIADRLDGDDWRIFATSTCFVFRKASRCITISRQYLQHDGNFPHLIPIYPTYPITTGPANEPIQTLIFAAQYRGPITLMTGCFVEGVKPTPTLSFCDSPHFFGALKQGIKWYHSFAPLENVASVAVFRDPLVMFCQGILLTYEDGSQIAVGQRRADCTVEFIDKPLSLCFRNFKFRPNEGWRDEQKTMICFQTSAGHLLPHPGHLRRPDGPPWNEAESEDTWTCHSTMEGTLGFLYYDGDEAYIGIE